MNIFIVTPSYNSFETINRTIQSVISQAGHFSLHYHVKDGGSNDGTVDILKRWDRLINHHLIPISCQSIVFSWKSSPDGGMYDAIVKGFQYFDTKPNDWLAWINADDVLMPTALPLLLKIDTDPVLCEQVNWVTGATATCKDECQNIMVDTVQCSDVIAQGLADGKHWCFVQQEGTFFRQKAWDSAGAELSFKGMRYAGDWNLWQRLAKNHKIFQFKFPTGMFSYRTGQLSQAFRSYYEREMLSVVSAQEKANNFLKLKNKNLDALYLLPDVKKGTLIIERKPIKNHLAYRIKRLSESEKPIKVVLQADDHNNECVPEFKDRVKPQRRRNLVFYDDEWQFPAITEKHAFEQSIKLLPEVSGVVYFAFPWATLIDLLHGGKKDAARLHAVLHETSVLLKPGERVVTVCQHILMLNYQNMFSDLGITDVFWTHAIINQSAFPKYPQISINPFPLYPVQAIRKDIDLTCERSILYSFVGARADKWYLTESRNFILEHLGTDKRGMVIGREKWHFDRVVYGHQINKKVIPVEMLDDKAAVDKFKEVLTTSIFSLCPSGSGPNSIRLWESIGLGSIPVILAETYLPPGEAALWEEAVIFCSETMQAIQMLPEQLEEIARDKALLKRKRHAMKQLWMLYGPDCFIYDIQKLFVELATEKPAVMTKAHTISFASIIEQAKIIEQEQTPSQKSQLTPFLLGCCTRAMLDPIRFKEIYFNNTSFRKACTLAIQHGKAKHSKLMSDTLVLKKIKLNEILPNEN